MLKMWSILFLFAFWTPSISGETFNVDVGRTGLNFLPSMLYNVAIGDVVNFHFYPFNNSVTQSTFDQPCKPRANNADEKPVFSGFVSVDDGVASKMWSMAINSTDPIWLYSSQGDHQHCRNGQSMVINPRNDTDQTLEAYMEAALNANVSSPEEVSGGVLVDDDGGQSDRISRARPSTTLRSSMTETSVNGAKSTSGVGSVAVNLIRELGLWGMLAVIFFITL